MKPVALLTLVAALATAGCATSPVPAVLPAELPAISEVNSPAPGIVVAGRLRPDDVARVRDAGVRHVVDLTLDSETPDFDEATAIRAAGVEYSNLPLRGAPDLTRDNVLAFDALLRAAKRPVLVHCSSSNRVGAMAALRAAWVDGKSLEEALVTGRAWGLKGLEGEVRQRIEASRARPAP